jgi:hypothetical protein
VHRTTYHALFSTQRHRHITQTATKTQQQLQTYKQTLEVSQRGHSKNTKDAYLHRTAGYGRTSAQNTYHALFSTQRHRHITLTATKTQQQLQTYKQTLLVSQRGHSKNIKDAYLHRTAGYGRTSAQNNIPRALLYTATQTHHTDSN